MREDGVTHAVESVGSARAGREVDKCEAVCLISHHHCRQREEAIAVYSEIAKCGPMSHREALDKITAKHLAQELQIHPENT
jgi:hypothetical protein